MKSKQCVNVRKYDMTSTDGVKVFSSVTEWTSPLLLAVYHSYGGTKEMVH